MAPRRLRYAARISALALGSALALLAACSDEADPPAASPAPGVEASSTEGASLVPRDPLPEARVAAILALLLERSPDAVALQVALDEIVAAHDTRFVAPLIELMRAGPARLAASSPLFVEVLRELSGLTLSRDWDQWVTWYGTAGLEPPPGFAAWKGRILAGIDPRFTEFLYEGVDHTIPIEAIVWGGVPVDGIRALERPPVLEAEAATYLDPGEPVFGVVAGGEARAYPLRIMDAHEMANDVLGGVPISLAYCTLCGSGIAYDARGADGVVYDFGTSGLLYESNKLMYDRQTGTLWSQFTGRPVVGPLVEAAASTSGSLLEVLPIVIARWSDWVARHPATTVLDIETGHGSGYTLGYPYLQYFTDGNPLFPVSRRSLQLAAKDWVLGLDIEGEQKAYALDALTAPGGVVVNDTLGGVDLVVVSGGPIVDVIAETAIVGELQYEAGGEVRAFRRPPGVTFEAGPDLDTLIDATGAAWRVTEDALIGPEGVARGERLPGHVAFWFGWFQFFPRTEVFGARG